jgi:fatty acid-binding protein DegV
MIKEKVNVFVLDVLFLSLVTYIEDKNLTAQAFYDKMAATEELPKTSQPSISDLVLQLENRLTAIHTCHWSISIVRYFRILAKYSISKR